MSNTAPLATLSFQNAGTGDLGAGVTTFGQVFAQGDLPSGAGLVVQINGTAIPVQVDVKTRYPDGSAKMAVLSVMRPELAAGTSTQVVLERASNSVKPTAINLSQALKSHSFVVSERLSGQTATHFNVFYALRQALLNGTASYWEKGPLATEARVTIPLAGSQRMVFDVTAYADGGVQVDAEFNNDGAMGAIGGTVDYHVNANLDGNRVASETLDQLQYQNWHQEFSTSGVDGGQGIGSPSRGWLNIQQDVAKFEQVGAIPRVDLSLSIPQTTLSYYESEVNSAGWDAPFSANNLTQYMPTTGGRPEIGITTEANGAWLLSQNPWAAAYAMGQAEAASGIPWNYWDTAHNTWLNTDNYPDITANTNTLGTYGDPASAGLTQLPVITGAPGTWVPDAGHQPDLSYIPYLMTGQRWMLDNLQAQAAWDITSVWNVQRLDGRDILVNHPQVRAAAWGLRAVDEAANVSPDGSAEKAYFTTAENSNWAWMVSQLPTWTAREGQAYGWFDPGAYALYDDGIAPWQQDFFASTVIQAASQGNADALTVLKWMSNFLVGRFLNAANGFNPRDGCAYSIAVIDSNTGLPFQTWAEIGQAEVARGLSNGDGWSAGGPIYALNTLAGIYELTGDQDALTAYQYLIGLDPSDYTAVSLAQYPNFAVALAGQYAAGTGSSSGTTGEIATINATTGQTITGTAYDDTITLGQPVTGVSVQLGDGNDTLILASGGANVIYANDIETIIGGNGDSTILLDSPGMGTVVDLGGSDNALCLDPAAGNTVSTNAQTVIGGSYDDAVTLTAPIQGGQIDLAGGNNHLTLAAGGTNSLTVGNVQTITGGSGSDTVTLDTLISNGVISLVGSSNKVFLASGGPNSVTVSNVRTIRGGSGNDTITATGSSAVTIHGGAGADTLTGGSGATVFSYSSASDSPVTGGDIITNFAPGVDRLNFSGLLDGSFSWLGTNAFTGSGHTEARFVDSSSSLLIDLNGNGVADMSMTLKGISSSQLSSSIFHWS